MKENLVSELCKSFPTPMYAFEEKKLAERVSYIKSRFGGIKICYAVKANPFIVKLLSSSVSRFEVCSGGEYHICNESGIDIEKLVISGVYKTPSVIEEIFARDGDMPIFTAESARQAELIENLAEKYGKRVRLILRLSSGNQFGLSENDIIDIIRKKADSKLFEMLGLQYYSGTQKASLKRLKREITAIDDFLTRIYDETGFTARELEFGPGFPVMYFSEESFDEDNYISELCNMLDSMKNRTEITIELGRALAASCGSYLTKVVDTKSCRNENYAIVDGGMHQLVYFGQSMAMRKPFLQVLPQKEAESESIWNICGSLCSANDILVKQLPIKGLSVGDIMVFQNTGAYCMTEGISLFLSRELPTVLIIGANGTASESRKQYETYKLNMSDKIC